MIIRESDAKVCAIIVSYRPDLEVLESVIMAIHGQVHRVVLVDNGSPEETVSCLRRLAADNRVHLFPCRLNLGVATGHNLGIEWARKNDCSHVLLLDQDSIADRDMVSALLAAHIRLTSQGVKVSAVGPRYRAGLGHSSFFVRFGFLKFKRSYCTSQSVGQCIEADFLITSGSLIALPTIDVIGGMDDGLFIDHVDTEWYLRAKYKRYRAFGICDAVMSHTLGTETLQVWFGRWRHVPRHNPLRHYYTFRNSMLLYKRDYAPRAWIVNDVVRLIFMFIFYTLRTAPRREHALMMIKGMVDGLKGRTGPYGPATDQSA
jgi:rhamnosyltransferase